MRLSLQQRIILDKLNQQPLRISQIKYLYSDSSIYRSLSQLSENNLIKRESQYIYITEKGRRAILLWH